MVVGQIYPQTYSNNYYPDLVIVSEDSLLLHGVYYKRWGLGINDGTNIIDSNYVYIIKGIGSTLGIKPYGYNKPFESYDALYCFSLNNSAIYPDSNYICDLNVNIHERNDSEKLIIYPNPTNEQLKIEVPRDKIGSVLTICNITGKVIINQVINSKVTIIDISNLAQAVYFVKLTNDKTVEVKRILKK